MALSLTLSAAYNDSDSGVWACFQPQNKHGISVGPVGVIFYKINHFHVQAAEENRLVLSQEGHHFLCL